MNRHERRKSAAQIRRVEMPAESLPRLMAFIDAFHRAPNDADIEVRIGKSEDGESAVLVSISGYGDHPMMAREARAIADIFEEAMSAYPDDPEGRTLPNIIMALRAAAERADMALGEIAGK